jgi:hypothetical protein
MEFELIGATVRVDQQAEVTGSLQSFVPVQIEACAVLVDESVIAPSATLAVANAVIARRVFM